MAKRRPSSRAATEVAPAREAAFRALRLVSSGRVDLGDALSRSRDPLSDTRDRALATDLVTGTLRWRGALDYQLQRLSRTPIARLDEAVVDALRLGSYQILYLERVPVSAVVNDAVEIVKHSGFRSATGFTNAVLRRLARERDGLVWPAMPATVESAADRTAVVEHLSVVHSHPRWLVERWVDRYGAGEARAWLEFNNRPPALTVCANRLRVTRGELTAHLAAEGIDASPTPTAPHGLVVEDSRVLRSQAFREGLCLVQDEASQIIPELVQAPAGARVLDACALPGGKTVALVMQSSPSGIVAATDVRERRVRLLAETLRRCGASGARVVHVADHDAFPFRDEAFDRVLVDAPCSGLGTIRRDPDIRWRRQPTDFPALARLQRELLRRVQPLVAPRGRLIYSTCSSEPEENEDVVAAFLSDSPEFRVVPLPSVAGLASAVAAMSTSDGYLRTSPLQRLEAFFGAVLERV